MDKGVKGLTIGGASFIGFLLWLASLSPTPPKPQPAVMSQPAAAPAISQPSGDFDRAKRDAARDAAFNCAVLRDAVNDAREAGAKAQRYGWHESYSQGMDMERAEATLRQCEQQ